MMDRREKELFIYVEKYADKEFGNPAAGFIEFGNLKKSEKKRIQAILRETI